MKKTDELGFLCGNKILDGAFPSIESYIEEGQYRTGNPDYDPWIWKDRASEEKKLVYGPFFMGKKGFISPNFYPVFYCAFHPEPTAEERWESGHLSKMQWDAWQLLRDAGTPLGVHELRCLLGVTPKKGGSALNTALDGLQHTCDIIIAGTRPMLDKSGKPYNTSVAFTVLKRWAPKEWTAAQNITPEKALEAIYNRAQEISSGVEMEDIKKIFARQLKNYMKSL